MAFLALPGLAKAACSYTSGADFPNAPSAFTYTAVADGGWWKPATWDQNQKPADDAIVCIPSGIKVTIIREEENTPEFVQIEGTLHMATNANTRLQVETLYVADGGIFRIGSPTNRLDADKTAELVFTSSGSSSTPFDLSWDPGQASRGLISDGKIRLYGAAKTPYVAMVLPGFLWV